MDCGNITRQYPSGVTVCACTERLPGGRGGVPGPARTLPGLSLHNWNHNPLRSEPSDDNRQGLASRHQPGICSTVVFEHEIVWVIDLARHLCDLALSLGVIYLSYAV